MCGSGSWLLFGPVQYEAVARVKAENTPKEIAECLRQHPVSPVSDPYFPVPIIHALQSDAVLGQAADDLNLDSNRNRSGSSPLEKAYTIKLLRQKIRIAQIRNTSLIEITATNHSLEEVVSISNAVAEAFRHYRQRQASRADSMAEIIDRATPSKARARHNQWRGGALLVFGLLAIGIGVSSLVGGSSETDSPSLVLEIEVAADRTVKQRITAAPRLRITHHVSRLTFPTGHRSSFWWLC